MGLIKQLKQFITGTSIYPITKSNAVYDDDLGRIDAILKKSATIDNDTPSTTSGTSCNLIDPVSGNTIMPITNTASVYDSKYGRLDTHLSSLITYGTTDLATGSKLTTGTIYVVYE